MSSRSLEDELQLSVQPDFLKCIAKEGLGVGGESVIFSTIVKKVNRVGKVQPRVLVLTSGAIYSFQEKKYKKSLRRIPLGEVKAILRGQNEGSEVFYLHLRSEYDYQYISPIWKRLSDAICATVTKVVGVKCVLLSGLSQKELEATVKTKQFLHKNKKKKVVSPSHQAARESTNRKLEEMLARTQLSHLDAKEGAKPGALPLTTSTHGTPDAAEDGGGRDLAAEAAKHETAAAAEAAKRQKSSEFVEVCEGIRTRFAGFIASYGHSLRTAHSLQSHFNNVVVRAGNGSGFSGSLLRQIKTLLGLFCNLELLPSFAAFVTAHSRPPVIFSDFTRLLRNHPAHRLRRWVLLCAWFWICVAAGEKGILVLGPEQNLDAAAAGHKKRRTSFNRRGAFAAESKFFEVVATCLSDASQTRFSEEEFDAFLAIATAQRTPPPAASRTGGGDDDDDAPLPVKVFGFRLVHPAILQRAVQLVSSNPKPVNPRLIARVTRAHAALVARHVQVNCHVILAHSDNWMAVQWPLLEGLKWPSKQELKRAVTTSSQFDDSSPVAASVTTLLTFLSTMFTTTLLYSPGHSWKLFQTFTRSIARYNGWRVDGVLFTRKWLQLSMNRIAASRALTAFQGPNRIRLWSATLLLARILEWFIFWYPTHPETDVESCREGFVLRQRSGARVEDGADSKDMLEFAQRVGIHFDMNATRCMDLPLVRSYYALLKRLKEPEKGTQIYSASHAVMADTKSIMQFLEGLERGDEVTESAIKKFVSEFSARKRHVVDGAQAPSPKPMRRNRLRKAIYQVTARNRVLRKFTSAITSREAKPFAHANAMAEITARLKATLLSGGEEPEPQEIHINCHRCGKGMVEGANSVCVESKNAFWHSTCFKCSDCNAPLEGLSFYLRDEGGSFDPLCGKCAGLDAESQNPSLTGEVEVCCVGCADPIAQTSEGPGGVVVMGQHWHPGCASCCDCGKAFFTLSEDGWVETESIYTSEDSASLCCSECLASQSGQRCGSCNAPLRQGERIVTLPNVEGVWHADCAACHSCGGAVDDFFTGPSGELLCPNCFRSDAALQCAGCGKPCDGYYLEIDGQPRHEGCCCCCECGIQVGGTIHYVDGQVYCDDDYAKQFCNRCRGCHKYIVDGGLEALGSSWHRECLVCSFGGCDRQLHGEENGSSRCCVGENGQPYCEQHVDTAHFQVCSACCGPVHGEGFVRVKSKAASSEQNEEIFHEYCLNCHLCGENLCGRKYFVEAGILYCERDYLGRFSKQCFQCLQPVVPGRHGARRIFGESFHSDCFRCFGCERAFKPSEPIARGPVTIPANSSPEHCTPESRIEAVFCRECHSGCFQSFCAGCFKPLAGGYVRTFPDSVLHPDANEDNDERELPWHVECVKCRVCGVGLSGQGVYLREHWPICTACNEKPLEATTEACAEATAQWKRVNAPSQSKIAVGKHAEEMSNRYDPFGPPPPEPQAWEYRDADGTAFGPFSAAQIQKWIDGGKLPRALPIRKVSDKNAEFAPLHTFFNVPE